MKGRVLMTLAIVIGFSAFVVFFVISEFAYDESPFDDRESLKEVVNSSTSCATFWRMELFAMWDNSKYDYQNDPIFQECKKALEFEKER